jgi:hypothetical protein
LAYSLVGIETAAEHSSGSGRTITVDKPSGVEPGDALFLFGPHPVGPAPEGWITLSNYRPGGTLVTSSTIRHRVADGTEPASITLDLQSSAEVKPEIVAYAAVRPDATWNRTTGKLFDARVDVYKLGTSTYRGHDTFYDPDAGEWPDELTIPNGFTGTHFTLAVIYAEQLCGAGHDPDHPDGNCFPDIPGRVLKRCSDCFSHFIATDGSTAADVYLAALSNCFPDELTEGRGAAMNIVSREGEPANFEWVSDHPLCGSNHTITWSIRMWSTEAPPLHGWGIYFNQS